MWRSQSTRQSSSSAASACIDSRRIVTSSDERRSEAGASGGVMPAIGKANGTPPKQLAAGSGQRSRQQGSWQLRICSPPLPLPAMRYAPPVWQPTNLQWWTLLIVALLIVAAWPPADSRSLAMKFVNWAVDPGDGLPTL